MNIKKIAKAAIGGADAARDIELINRFSQRELSPDEVYAFKLHVCDNDIDRDTEAFAAESLDKLAQLIVGKTVLFDHSARAENQIARIYDAKVERTAGTTRTGEPFARLVTYCYMLRTEENKSLIAEIEAGIKKEVSVGCACAEYTCSICGANRRISSCEHVKGRTYNGTLCYHKLESVTDAYEVSFVAIPAQRNAGVTKSYKPENQTKKGEKLMGINFLKSKIKTITEQIEVKNAQMESAEDVVTYKSLSSEVHDLENDREAFKQLLADAVNKAASADDTGGFTPLMTFKSGSNISGEGAADIKKTVENLAADLKAGKEISVSREVQKYLQKTVTTASNIVLEEKYSRSIAEGFNEIAQTVDLVDAFTLDGGKAYTVAFAIDTGDADYTGEGDVYHNNEGTFGENSTGYAKITNSAKVSEEVIELPNADYLSRIVGNVRKSIRKKMSAQIIAGKGDANTLRGIYNTPENAMPPAYKVEVDNIDAGTLRKIVFAYGGDEDVESPATLFLNKMDLAAFASIEDKIGHPVYAITYNGASGTIEQVGGGLRVPYTINSACKALSGGDTEAGDKTMVYGDPKAYELPMFSPLTIKRLDERYADEGKVGFIGKVICGGVVNKYKAFLPVVKGGLHVDPVDPDEDLDEIDE